MKELSIIVPVYNVDKYVKRCIESILRQTFSEFELIVVNDGSTDHSGEICKQYAEADKRIVYIEQLNAGVSAARNAALDIASGRWIGFVDADDFIDVDFYKTLMSHIDKNVGIVCCGVRAVDTDGKVRKHLQYNNIPQDIIKLSRDDAYEHFLNPSKRFLYWSPWDKIIRADIAKKNRFEVGRKYGEDFFYCFKCLSMCENIIYVPEEKYNYLLRPNSAIRSKSFTPSSFDSFYFAKKASEEIDSLAPLSKECAEMNLAIVAARTIRFYWQSRAYLNNALRVDYKECVHSLRSINNKYLKKLNIKHKILVTMARVVPYFFAFRKKL